jgi:hypothetical protein
MTIVEAMKERHSVRSYTDKPIPENTLAELNKEIAEGNSESGLHIQLVTNEPAVFEGFMAHYGKFSGVKNYIALIGKKDNSLDEKLGYYGERIVLKAQALGLNTCWVGMTFSRGKCSAVTGHGEKFVCVISLGYGSTQGAQHKSKQAGSVCETEGEMPQWFKAGIEAALLAPTAVNQQRFMFTLSEKTVEAKSTGGFFSKVDLGIVKYHFELGAGAENFSRAIYQ